MLRFVLGREPLKDVPCPDNQRHSKGMNPLHGALDQSEGPGVLWQITITEKITQPLVLHLRVIHCHVLSNIVSNPTDKTPWQ